MHIQYIGANWARGNFKDAYYVAITSGQFKDANLHSLPMNGAVRHGGRIPNSQHSTPKKDAQKREKHGNSGATKKIN